MGRISGQEYSLSTGGKQRGSGVGAGSAVEFEQGRGARGRHLRRKKFLRRTLKRPRRPAQRAGSICRFRAGRQQISSAGDLAHMFAHDQGGIFFFSLFFFFFFCFLVRGTWDGVFVNAGQGGVPCRFEE